jgi:hypothetical protein
VKTAGLTLALMLVSGVASADPKASCGDQCGTAPFVYDWYVRALVGLGSVPNLPYDDRTGNTVVTTEIGFHPLKAAFSSGFSMSNAADWNGLWNVLTPGLFAQLDLTYILLSGLWAYPPPRSFPLRIAVGGRFGLGISNSFRPTAGLPVDMFAPEYELLRPELMSYLDFDYALSSDRRYAVVFRMAVDTAVNLSQVFRWSGSVGLSSAWGDR